MCRCISKAVVIPCGITAQMNDQDRKQLIEKCQELVSLLQAADIRTSGDFRDNYSPGWKFNHWELKVVIMICYCNIVCYEIAVISCDKKILVISCVQSLL